MRIAIFGLGYVGCVSLACLAKSGHLPFGIDVDPQKIRQLEQSQATVIEPGLSELISEYGKLIEVSTQPEKALANADISFICVGTPNSSDGSLELANLHRVAETIASCLVELQQPHVIAIRSTVNPGTCASISSLIAEVSGKRAGVEFEVVAHPEFLREGSAINDYFDPSLVVVGSTNPKGIGVKYIKELYKDFYNPENVKVVSPRTAESIKLVNNSWHALKVTFGNEIGSICKALNIDSKELIELFLADTKLNVSSSYLKPGFAFGGSCLPKDLRALRYHANKKNILTPLLDSVEISNEAHIERAVELIKRQKGLRIAILGVAFKSGTDDVRFSPSVKLANMLLALGYEVRLHDTKVTKSINEGTTKRFILPRLGELVEFLNHDLHKTISNADIVILVNNDSIYTDVAEMLTSDQTLFELGAKSAGGICKRIQIV